MDKKTPKWGLSFRWTWANFELVLLADGGCMLAFQRTCLHLVSFHPKDQTKIPFQALPLGQLLPGWPQRQSFLTGQASSRHLGLLWLKPNITWTGETASLPRAFMPVPCSPPSWEAQSRPHHSCKCAALSFGLHLLSSLFVLGPHDAKQLVWLVFVSVNGWNWPIWCSLETNRGFTEGAVPFSWRWVGASPCVYKVFRYSGPVRRCSLWFQS